MILSICLNCSLDTRYTIPNFQAGDIHPADPPEVSAGGKGLNLARVAALLGESVAAAGLAGEADIPFFTREMSTLGIEPYFTPTPVPTRRCLNILDPDAGRSTEVLERGFPVDIANFQEILALVRELAPRVKVICASGSVPPGLPEDVYAQLGNLAQELGKPFILDARDAHLREGIKARPFAVKPNRRELETWAGKSLETREEIQGALTALNDAGVTLAVVSLGAEGAIAACAGKIWRIRTPQVEVVNTVGSGDAFTAGLAAGLARNLVLTDMLALAAASGTANALHLNTGCVELLQVEELLPCIALEEGM